MNNNRVQYTDLKDFLQLY